MMPLKVNTALRTLDVRSVQQKPDSPKAGNTPTNRNGQANNGVHVEGAGALTDAFKINITLAPLALRGVQKQLHKAKRGHDMKKLVWWNWTMLKQATRSPAEIL